MFPHVCRSCNAGDACAATALQLQILACVCRYDFFDIYMSEYVADYQNWDMAVVTLKQPVGLTAGWMGIKALPPPGACTADWIEMSQIRTVGYPVEKNSTSYQWVSGCKLQVRCTDTVSDSVPLANIASTLQADLASVRSRAFLM